MPSTVSVHPLSAGCLTLPERFFVEGVSDAARKTVPSLSFLIQHLDDLTNETTRIVFDLGIRRDISAYSSAIQSHARSRQPLITKPDVVESLARGGLVPDDIDFVIFSHVHWDHIGMPSDFPTSRFVVGSGALDLLSGKSKLNNGSHSHFEAGLLPLKRTIELPNPHKKHINMKNENGVKIDEIEDHSAPQLLLDDWESFDLFPSALDIFGDSSCYIVSSPGHLAGHVNLLCRISPRSPRWVLLAGDSCHDIRLLTGEKQIATWTDEKLPGVTCCIHSDRPAAEKTIKRIREAQRSGVAGLDVEVVFAHDVDWEQRSKEQGSFWPGQL